MESSGSAHILEDRKGVRGDGYHDHPSDCIRLFLIHVSIADIFRMPRAITQVC